MNAAPSSSGGYGNAGRALGGLAVLIVAGVLLYYLYDYMFTANNIKKQAIIIPSPISAQRPTDIDVSKVDLSSQLYTGGTMALSFWIYVTGLGSGGSASKKHIVSIGASEGKTNTEQPTLMVYLGGGTNTLYVKVNDTTTGYDYSSIMSNPGTTQDNTDKCNIQNFEFGRWVNVTVVLNNNVCDTYIDGKLSRSCVLKGQFVVSGKTKVFILNQLAGSTRTDFNGSLSNMVFYNYALAPDDIYRIYMTGPSGANTSLLTYLYSFFGQLTATTANTAGAAAAAT